VRSVPRTRYGADLTRYECRTLIGLTDARREGECKRFAAADARKASCTPFHHAIGPSILGSDNSRTFKCMRKVKFVGGCGRLRLHLGTGIPIISWRDRFCSSRQELNRNENQLRASLVPQKDEFVGPSTEQEDNAS
jgi:hypothetical protein